MEKNIGIDIFSGAGGLSLGAENAGINVLIAIEKDKYAAQTFQLNHPDTIVLTDDIRSIDPTVYIEKNPFIVFGGPPCQGFSFSNTKTRTKTNQNNHLFLEFLRFIELLQPDWFLFENVEGIVTFEDGHVVELIKSSFERLGYRVEHEILYASDYGVPQHRNRFFLVGNRKDIQFSYPAKLGYTVTVNEAIEDLPNLENGENSESLPYSRSEGISAYANKMRGRSNFSKQNFVSKNTDLILERYNHIRQGQNWRAIPDDLMTNYSKKENCHSGIYKRLQSDKPSIVISNYRKNMLIHPFQNRGLSVREAARLQSFPDEFIFRGYLQNMQQQIGNAVPPLLAEAIFKQIILLDATK